jgi:hypothetical protein
MIKKRAGWMEDIFIQHFDHAPQLINDFACPNI